MKSWVILDKVKGDFEKWGKSETSRDVKVKKGTMPSLHPDTCTS